MLNKYLLKMFALRRFKLGRNKFPLRYFGNIIPESGKNTAIILEASSNDIHFNLATEEYLFERQNLECPLLFLWRNSRTIVIGKHQNPYKECNIQLMEYDKINLARYIDIREYILC